MKVTFFPTDGQGNITGEGFETELQPLKPGQSNDDIIYCERTCVLPKPTKPYWELFGFKSEEDYNKNLIVVRL